jgi:hypothetical protein
MENKSFVSAIKLHNYILEDFWNGHAIVGPDPGLYLESRLLRFIKSYLPSINWCDNHYFLQAQGYWIKSNWDLFEITGDISYKKVAIACSKQIIDKQKNNGSWEYPLKAWKKYASTVEGTWASLGLLETFKHTKEWTYLKGALKWYDFLINRIGFQTYKDSLAINYFDIPKYRVPNNTTLVLWFLAELYGIEKDPKFLKFNEKMIRFTQLCQNSNGELRYTVEKEHYLCYHYNAFEFLDLYHYQEIINDERIRIILKKLAKFLSTGVTEIGSVKFDCFQTFPEVIFFSGVVGAALTSAASIGFKGYEKHTKCAYNFLFENQRPDGSFIECRHAMPYIRKPISHGFLIDKRSYPGGLCFILQHFLIKAKSETAR